MPITPASPSARTSGMVVVPIMGAFGLPLWKTRTRPGRSVTNIWPPGANATSHGMVSPSWTTPTVRVGTAASAGAGSMAVRHRARVAKVAMRTRDTNDPPGGGEFWVARNSTALKHLAYARRRDT